MTSQRDSTDRRQRCSDAYFDDHSEGVPLITFGRRPTADSKVFRSAVLMACESGGRSLRDSLAMKRCGAWIK